jgi:hypothetical protein
MVGSNVDLSVHEEMDDAEVLAQEEQEREECMPHHSLTDGRSTSSERVQSA